MHHQATRPEALEIRDMLSGRLVVHLRAEGGFDIELVGEIAAISPVGNGRP